MKNNNIRDCTDDNCTGCGMCAVVCQKNALEICLDENGFYKPKIIDEKCISCGICKQVCAKFENRYKQTNVDKIECYSAINRNNQLLRECSSGAISEELMKECIKQGYSIIAVEYDYEKDIAKHTVCKNVESLFKYRGSKYFQSYTVEALKEIVKNGDEKYAIFGTPCQIYAIKKYAIRHKLYNLLLIDIFCHGVPTMFLWKSYIQKLNKPLKKISFRTKDYGWHNYSNAFVDSTGKKTISSKINDRFYDLFFSKQCFNKACYTCQSRSTVEYCDIRLGDFWGKKFNCNYDGVSAIIVRTKKGEDILNSIKSNLKLQKVKFNEIIEAQSYGKNRTFEKETRNEIIICLKNYDIEKAYSKYYVTLNLKIRVTKIIKNLVKRIPKKIQFRLRGKL